MNRNADWVKPNKKIAFTLAEVLITLGIIGVVSAITIPTLIQNYKNQVVETRLKKVYSVMNQAIQRAEADYGSRELWDFSDTNFWNKYFAPYVKVLKTETFTTSANMNYLAIYFPDGSLLNMSDNNLDYFFYPNAKNFDVDTMYDNAGISNFIFIFYPKSKYSLTKNAGFVPYSQGLKEDLSNMLDGDRHSCNKDASVRGFCTYYIFQNGWKIPKEYPFKVR